MNWSHFHDRFQTALAEKERVASYSLMWTPFCCARSGVRMARKSPDIWTEVLRILEDDADQVFWGKATREASYYGLSWKKRFSEEPEHPIHQLDRSDALAYAAWFLESLGDAAAHYSDLLTRALSNRKRIGQEELDYLRSQSEKFIKARVNKSVVRNWFTAVITEAPPPAVPKGAFDEMIGLISEEVANQSDALPRMLVEHKLRLALVLAAGSKVWARLPILPPPVWPEEDWRKRNSFSAREAEIILGVSSRTIRRRALDNKLTRTPKGRIVRDEKFEHEFQNRHGPVVTVPKQKRRRR